jgi:hypothetical protein
MTNIEFGLIWALSFLLYLLIYTYWIPLKTQKRIETWLRSSESDETLLEALDIIVRRIREQTLIDFEEFMLPQARENLQKFWSGAMGNVAKEMKKTEEGGQLNLMHNIASSLQNESWYVQALGSKLLPMIAEATQKEGKPKPTQNKGMGLLK